MGVWIETLLALSLIVVPPVTPHVGAWIETKAQMEQRCILKSLPMWERGLKPARPPSHEDQQWSLPMWERGWTPKDYVVREVHLWSLPMWERGLKLTVNEVNVVEVLSLPMWERGLSKFAPNVTYAEGDRLWEDYLQSH